MTENSLAIFTRASQMLAEADTIQKAKELKDLALTAADWAKRKGMGEEAIGYAKSYAMRAEIKMGEMLAQTERATGSMGIGPVIAVTPRNHNTPPTLAELGLTKRESSEAQMLASLPEEKQEAIITGKVTRADVRREIKRKDIIEKLENTEAREVKAMQGIYDVIVIDPPWPMEKIERDVAPDQVGFDYMTMTEAEIKAVNVPTADDCHVWLWTTHKFLPMAFRLLDSWGLKYVCCFVWHKPGGFQPFGLPQYNCEFALYARKGTPAFIDTKAFPVCFNAPRGQHSEKPEAFYEIIRRVTSGRRLDMFNRRTIEGFDTWGLEAI